MAKKVIEAEDDLRVIDMMVDQVRILITDHWLEIDKARKDNDGMLAIGLQSNIDYNGQERAVKTAISFSTGRVTDSRSDVINPNQPDLLPKK